MMRLVEKKNLDRKVVGDVMRKKGEEEKKDWPRRTVRGRTDGD